MTDTTGNRANPTHLHFSGVCGTAMASLAVLLKGRGHKITGSDENIYPPMSSYLAENAIDVQTPYRAENLQPHPDMVVIGNSLSRGNPEVEYALEAHLPYISMAELLKESFIRGNTSIVISGTHGKTTTTSLAAHVFTECGLINGFLVGGIPGNFVTSARDVEKGNYFIVEGDEYDTCFFDKRSKFFHYLPDRLILTSIEFDHADIFENIDQIKLSFKLMLRQIPKNGLIIVNGDDKNALEIAKTGYSPYLSFGTNLQNDAVIKNCRSSLDNQGMSFDLHFKKTTYQCSIPLLGEFNVRNAVSVILLALNEGADMRLIQKALDSFKNVCRRQQRLTQNTDILVYDDFAHHPTAISETLKAMRQSRPGARIHAVYEARTATSVRHYHQNLMAPAFEDADTVVFYKLHGQNRIEPEERLDLVRIVDELRSNDKDAWLFEDLEQILSHCINIAQTGDLFLFMSNAAFGGIQHQLAARLDERC